MSLQSIHNDGAWLQPLCQQGQIGKCRHFLARWIPVWAAVTWALRVYDFIPFAVKNI